MTGYVALVRGLNVGGGNQVKMGDLRDVFEAAGHGEVATYLQSGNVVFTADGRRRAASLESELEQLIDSRLGLHVHVLLRTAGDLQAVIERHPFAGAAADPRHLHVTFLKERPDPRTVESLEVPSSGDDVFHVADREVYLHCPDGYGRTKLDNASWERRLDVAATTRNWNTVAQLAALVPGS